MAFYLLTVFLLLFVRLSSRKKSRGLAICHRSSQFENPPVPSHLGGLCVSLATQKARTSASSIAMQGEKKVGRLSLLSSHNLLL
jgi:hypothetical protein